MRMSDQRSTAKESLSAYQRWEMASFDPAPPPHQEVAVDVIQREIIVLDPVDQHVLDRRRAGRAGMHRDEGVLGQDQGIEAGVREASAQCGHRPRHRGG